MAKGARPDQRVAARQREARAWELWLEGLRPQAIADRLVKEGYAPSLTRQAVRKMLRRVETRMAERLDDRAERETVRQLARLEHVTAEALAAWERSKRASKQIREKQVADRAAGGADRIETTRAIAVRTGEPAFLKTALAALADTRKVLGLDAAARVRVEEAGPADPRRQELDQRIAEMSDEELEQFERTYARLAGVESLIELLHGHPGHTN